MLPTASSSKCRSNSLVINAIKAAAAAKEHQVHQLKGWAAWIPST
jgi:hypothetical protein